MKILTDESVCQEAIRKLEDFDLFRIKCRMLIHIVKYASWFGAHISLDASSFDHVSNVIKTFIRMASI